MNPDDVKDNIISLIIWNSEKEEDVRVYSGKLHLEKDEYYFVNPEKGWRVSLDEEQLSRLHPVPDDLKEMLLNADYALSLSMGDLPPSGSQGFQATGMQWTDETPG